MKVDNLFITNAYVSISDGDIYITKLNEFPKIWEKNGGNPIQGLSIQTLSDCNGITITGHLVKYEYYLHEMAREVYTYRYDLHEPSDERMNRICNEKGIRIEDLKISYQTPFLRRTQKRFIWNGPYRTFKNDELKLVKNFYNENIFINYEVHIDWKG